MSELVPGGNVPLPHGTLTFRVPGPFDLSVLVTGDDGRVRDDGDFVFWNQPSAPGVRLGTATVTLDRQGLRPGAGRVTLVVSSSAPGTPLSRLPSPRMEVADLSNRTLTHFTPRPAGQESVLLLAEVYRHRGAWKLRALGQGYADGLAGVARDFGVDVSDDGTSDIAPDAAPAGGPPDAFTSLVNAERQRVGVPPITSAPALTAAAQAHATAMARQNRLGTEGPDGRSLYQLVTAHGYAYLDLAEHLVSGPRTPDQFLAHCLDGAADRSTVTARDITHFGVASAVDSRGETYWTALWARPLTPDGLARAVAEVLSRTNAERAVAGLSPLAPDPVLAGVAQAYSADMAARGFYSHTSPEGLQPWDRAAAAGSDHRGIGENIAFGQRSAATVVQGWMNSPGHRANILKPDFTHLGVGFASGGPGGTYWTQLFGMR
ncbi:CAP domain-containing protein [Streptomyces sp. NBC_01167]|uniref:CAP domain-containing protein n=1 Tax=Streptomyces sp. NBC_01167 TaxID=2903756 RepID=UPI00386823E3|nr:CAP domain-containing protein [Streptomyces sp. NBC_01167]